jgi:hypothetical protein
MSNAVTTTAGKGWQKMTIRFVAEESGSTNVGLRSSPTSGANDYAIDDIRLVTTTPFDPKAPTSINGREFTADVTGIEDNVGTLTGNVATGGFTDDTSLLLSGTVSEVLKTGYQVAIYDGTEYLGNAMVVGTTWTFHDNRPLTSGKTVSYLARVADLAGNQSKAGTAYTATVDTISPVAELAIKSDQVLDVLNRRENKVSIKVTSPGLAAGDVIQLKSDDGNIGSAYTVVEADVKAGEATVNVLKSELNFEGKRVLTATMKDLAGNLGTTAASLPVTVDSYDWSAPDAISVIKPNQVKYIKASYFAEKFNALQIAKFSPEAFAALTAEQLGKLSQTAYSGITREQVSSWTLANANKFTRPDWLNKDIVKFNGIFEEVSSMEKNANLNELATTAKKVLNYSSSQNIHNYFTGVYNIGALAWTGSLKSDAEKFINSYDNAYSKYGRSALDDFSQVNYFYDILSAREYSYSQPGAINKLIATTQSFFDTISMTNSMIKKYADTTGSSFDVKKYTSDTLNQVIQLFDYMAARDGVVDGIKNQYDVLKNIQINNVTRQGLNVDTLNWALNGGSLLSNKMGGIYYNGKPEYTFREAINESVKDVFRAGSSFLRSATMGIAQVVENKRVKDAQKELMEILDIFGVVFSLGVGLGSIVKGIGAGVVSSLTSIGVTLNAANTSFKKFSEKWFEPNYLGQYSGINNISANIESLAKSDKYVLPDDLKASQTEFINDLNDFVVEWCNASKKGETTLWSNYFKGRGELWMYNFNDNILIGETTVNVDAGKIFRDLPGKIIFEDEFVYETIYASRINLPGYITSEIKMKVNQGKPGKMGDNLYAVNLEITGYNLV